MKTANKIARWIKSGLAAGAIALGGGCAASMNSYEFKNGPVEQGLRVKAGMDVAAVRHSLSKSKRTFDSVETLNETATVSNSSCPYSAKLSVEDEIKLNGEITLLVGTEFRYSLFNQYPSETIGYMAEAWDVTYYAGINPQRTIELYSGLDWQINHDWDVKMGIGLPYTRFRWKKSYTEQRKDDEQTTLESDYDEKFGVGARLGIFYNWDEEMNLGLELEQERYNDVHLGGEKTPIDITRASIGFHYKF